MGRQETRGESDYRVLVVDDDREIRSLLVHYLGEHEDGFDVETASNGREALSILRSSFDPHAIILDLSMPTMGGLETLKRIREESHDVLTIVLSARAGEEEQLQAFDLGAVDVVEKPFSPEVLLTRLQLNLERKERLRELGRETNEPTPEH